MVIESFLLSGVRGNSILSELNHFFYSFFAFGLTSIVTLQRALSAPEDEGLLVSRGTVGRFVTSDEAALERARRTARQDALEKLAEEAQAAGLTLDDLVQYIREEAQSAAIPSDDPDPHV